MRFIDYLCVCLGLVFLMAFFNKNAGAVETWQLKETRYCGAPERDSHGTIKRSRAVLMAYARLHPCPSNGLPDTGCKGWALQHVIPLACGGCDSVSNLFWAPDKIKSCAEEWCLDRHERKINASRPPQPDTANCVNKFPVNLEAK